METDCSHCTHVVCRVYRVTQVRHGCGSHGELHGQCYTQSTVRGHGRPDVQPQGLQDQKGGMYS